MFVANEKNGAYVSDECFKMAITDAIGTAAKMIGLASDVYMGIKSDNTRPQSKYETLPPQQNTTPTQSTDDKPWLNQNTDNWKNVVKAMNEGFTLLDIEKKYKISKTNKEKLLEDVSK
jgi:hypothetical protein